MTRLLCRFATALIVAAVPFVPTLPAADAPRRTGWTTSRVIGTPEPPPPYKVERVFPRLMFKNPVVLTNAPGTRRLFLGEQEGRIVSFVPDQDPVDTDPFLDVRKDLKSWDTRGEVGRFEALYGLTFHPQFAANRFCYVCYVLTGKKGPLWNGTRVSRFKVLDTDPPRVDPASEQVLLTWLSGGHNGGCLAFGPDGYLYISTGDAANPNPPDVLDTGQDLSDLLSSILRIDVDRTEGGKPYAIPADNPFVQLPRARPENWAYGFRNPWKMSFDRKTGDLWVGDVGWELWEMIYRVRRGGNYGWSVMEGRQPVRPDSRQGPTPIEPPAIDFPHSEAASITGGIVYHGKRLPELAGAYICGDWVTGKLWASRFDKEKLVSHKEIAQAGLRIITFTEDNDGEMYLVHYDDKGTIHRLVVNQEPDRSASFPRRLSETGIFSSVKDQQPAPGVVPYAIQAAQWVDHAQSERFVALPGTDSTVRMYDQPVRIPGTFFDLKYLFPDNGLLVRTFSLEMERGNPASRRRVETQILHYDRDTWRGYSYRWKEDQTDAELVPSAGAEQSLTVVDPQAPGGKRQQTWRFSGRMECLQCHNPWAGHVLGFTPQQLVGTQLSTLRAQGIVTPWRKQGDRAASDFPKITPLVNPYEKQADLDQRARSYLHVNCSHCHQFGAGGTADIELRSHINLAGTKLLDVRPAQGTFEIAQARLVAPGDPFRSVLFYRIAKTGGGRMPHIGSECVDEPGVRLLHDWIRKLPAKNPVPANTEDSLLEQLHANGEAAALEAVKQLVTTTRGAFLLAHALGEQQVPEPLRGPTLQIALSRPEPQIRDLFERFIPAEQRVKRLGMVIKPEQILARTGNAERGRQVFQKTAGVACANCHRINGTGSTLGPDLSQIGKKLNAAQLLESILEPSKTIDPQYVPWLAETRDGKVHSGLLVRKTDTEIVLRDASDKEVRLPAGQVETLVQQRKSLMPELLLRDMTAEQVADLLAFLASLK